MNASTTYKVRVDIEPREDGGLRVSSVDLPELVLSHSDPDLVIADIPRALEAILAARLGQPVRIDELSSLPSINSPPAQSKDRTTPSSREFSARAA